MNMTETYQEITSQTAAWTEAVELTAAADLPDPEAYSQVIFTGCGSTYYLSLAAAALYQELTGHPARGVPASELLLNPRTVVQEGNRYLLVAISRSGTTTETIRAVRKFKDEGRGTVLAITNYPTDLAGLSDSALVIERGQEESVAQTRSFASMFVAATALAARMGRHGDLMERMRGLPAVGEGIIARYEPFAKKMGENMELDRFYFLGSGPRYGLACEVSLKMKEMTNTHCEPFHFLEFRHGPMSMVGSTTAILGLVSETNRAQEAKVLEEMRSMGATVAAVGEAGPEVAFNSRLPEAIRGVLYLPILQLMACYRSLAKGLNPDRPEKLTAVVKLDL